GLPDPDHFRPTHPPTTTSPTTTAATAMTWPFRRPRAPSAGRSSSIAIRPEFQDLPRPTSHFPVYGKPWRSIPAGPWPVNRAGRSGFVRRFPGQPFGLGPESGGGHGRIGV